MRIRGNQFIAVLAIVLLGLAVPKVFAVGVCEDVETVVNKTADDVCEAIDDAAKRCFTKLNARYYVLKKNPGKSRQARLAYIAKLRSQYERAATDLSTYDQRLKKFGKACLNQSGSLEVWVEELQKDLADLKRPGF